VIDIKNLRNFDAAATADSGQVFRAWNKPDGVHFVSGREYAVVAGGEIISTNDEYFANYFDLQTDYDEIQRTIKLSKENIESCGGIRILCGDFAEIVISFIISANNNIKRIKKTISALCEAHGEKLNFRGATYYAFPTTAALSKISAEEFAAFGCGYRAPYLVKTAAALNTMSFAELSRLPNTELYKKLTALHGVGDKVARCIMLFAFHRLDIMPTDTWIIKSADKFITPAKTAKQTAVRLQDYFGEYAGIAQQYIFYYTQFLRKKIE
jgi:N-glycosylase/DNA lyase